MSMGGSGFLKHPHRDFEIAPHRDFGFNLIKSVAKPKITPKPRETKIPEVPLEGAPAHVSTTGIAPRGPGAGY
jgi:hypothetical protein